jgi:uncharacterized repeat protein (TIGR03837 family)
MDLYCHVIDNFGDIGVSWRIARQLARRGHSVRLWVDDLASFRFLCQSIDPSRPVQTVDRVEVHRWVDGVEPRSPGDVVVEMFGCDLPAGLVERMAEQPKSPLWIDIEYLSAEPWVNQSHGLPSPHPRLPLTRWFFFPGVRNGTGGLPESFARATSCDGEGARADAARLYGLAPRRPDVLEVFLFAYPSAPAAALAQAWVDSPVPVRCLVPQGAVADHVARALGRDSASPGQAIQAGALTVQRVPFVDQDDFDQVLAGCDVAFVRGEDSFAQIQWHGRPFVWQIYPQSDAAHRVKLDAFLHVYAEGLQEEAAQSLTALWHGWNGYPGSHDLANAWRAFLSHRATLQRQAELWQGKIAALGGLTGHLEAFIRERL